MVGKPLNRYEILELIDRGEKIPYPDDCSQVVHELIWADHVWRCRSTGLWHMNPSGARALKAHRERSSIPKPADSGVY